VGDGDRVATHTPTPADRGESGEDGAADTGAVADGVEEELQLASEGSRKPVGDGTGRHHRSDGGKDRRQATGLGLHGYEAQRGELGEVGDHAEEDEEEGHRLVLFGREGDTDALVEEEEEVLTGGAGEGGLHDGVVIEVVGIRDSAPTAEEMNDELGESVELVDAGRLAEGHAGEDEEEG